MEILEVENGPHPKDVVESKEDRITLRMKIFQFLDNPASSNGVSNISF
jgi:hypothetical protein